MYVCLWHLFIYLFIFTHPQRSLHVYAATRLGRQPKKNRHSGRQCGEILLLFLFLLSDTIEACSMTLDASLWRVIAMILSRNHVDSLYIYKC